MSLINIIWLPSKFKKHQEFQCTIIFFKCAQTYGLKFYSINDYKINKKNQNFKNVDNFSNNYSILNNLEKK